MSQRIFFSMLIIIFGFSAQAVIGDNDIFSFMLMCLTALIMSPVILEFQMGGRQLLANHFKNSSSLKERIKKPGFFSYIFAFLVSIMTAIGLIILIKGIAIGHGLIAFLVILFIMTLAFFPILGESVENSTKKDKILDNTKSQEIINENLVESASNYTSFIASLIIGIIILNVFMAAVLSAQDTSSFLTSEITLNNFKEESIAKALSYNDINFYSRGIINAYIISDNFREGLINEIFNMFFQKNEKQQFFYIFYLVVFFSNLVKLVPFSVGIVILLRGVRRYSDQAQVQTNKIYQRAQPYLLLFTKLIKTQFNKLKTQLDKKKGT